MFIETLIYENIVAYLFSVYTDNIFAFQETHKRNSVVFERRRLDHQKAYHDHSHFSGIPE